MVFSAVGAGWELQEQRWFPSGTNPVLEVSAPRQTLGCACERPQNSLQPPRG